MPRRNARPLAALAAALALGVTAAAPAHAATDPLFDEQWALSNPEATGAQEAWTQTRGDGVLVAVLDSGVQLSHPDLAAKLWRNKGEVPGNGADDDRNGFVDDVHGANMIANNGNVDDDEGHGTHVAGIVAAQAGNDAGGMGIAPGATIMAVKVLDASRAGNSTWLARGIRYAVDAGAEILNVSINGDGTSSDLEDALRYAGERGATVVASAGNNSRNIDLTPSYPASSSAPAVLSVTATESTGGLLSIANRGPSSIDLAAPGGTILSTARGSRYELRQGTSMAAPFVAGSLALLAAARPDLSQPSLRSALLQSAPRPSALAGLLGSGALDVGAAMHRVLPGDMWRGPGAAATAAEQEAERLRLLAKSKVRAGRAATVRWKFSGDARVERWRVSLDGRTVGTVNNGERSLARKRVSRTGRHRWKVVGVDAAGKRVVSATRSFRVVRKR
ncbi:MAG TPA: S8 family peptidase [Solirubrobacteraceae bacterium]|nr:S8 family peptidase [Solirubrobacteraceae bacterium]